MTVKGLSLDIISGCKEIIKVRNVIIKLMQRCEKLSEKMENIVSYLTKNTELNDSDDKIEIKKQPELLNKE